MGGGVYVYESRILTTTHTIIGDNDAVSAPDCHGTIQSQDYNLIEDDTLCQIDGVTTHNITGQDPVLARLDDYGGPTSTRWLDFGSPAIDAGASTCNDTAGSPLTHDQRGGDYLRPENGNCDIGAIEVQWHDLSVSIAGTGDGSVLIHPSARNCTTGTCTEAFTETTIITLTASVGAETTFVGWDSSDPCASVTGEVCSFTMDADYSVTATFDAIPVDSFPLFLPLVILGGE
jgi:hypothetical protein